MKGLRSTLLLLLVLVGLGGYIYFQGAKPAEDIKTEKVFPGLDATKIDELKVQSESGDVTTLKKTDGVWKIVDPIAVPASETDAGGITSTVAALDIVRVVDEAPTDVKEYGLDTPQIAVDFKGDGGKISGRLIIGVKSAAGGNMYARRDDQKRVLLVAQTNEGSLNRSTFDLRDKHFFRLDRTKVDSVDLAVAGAAGQLTKKGDDWTMVKPVQSRADSSAVDGLFNRIDSAEMKSVVTANPSPADLKKFGFDKPQATITLHAAGDARSLFVGAKADDGSTYVRESSKPDVYTVDNSTADDFKKSVDDYRRKELFDFRAFNATHVELTQGGQTVILERVKAKEAGSADSWHRVSPNPGDPDRSKVETLLAGLADIRATSFLSTRTKTGLDSPALTVVAKFDDGKKEEHVSFGKNGADAFGARPDEPGAMKIEADKLAEALKALDEISK